MADWVRDAVFYHIFPLGALGAEATNDGCGELRHRLPELAKWLPYVRSLGANTILLGPVFESCSHGYDTRDLYTVDRRLGTNDDLAAFVRAAHGQGIRVVLDAVFNHVGRDFAGFRDVQEKRKNSSFAPWFHGLDFSGNNKSGDGFSYSCWDGHESLVKLDTNHPPVEAWLLGAVDKWITEYGVDGLRLDAADSLDPAFLRVLHGFVKSRFPDCWLMGEVVHGDYTRTANPAMLDAVTNYEVYKGFWSAPNDRNCHEIAYALERQFGPAGIYRGLPLYNFLDNHDVDRIAERVREKRHLYPVHALLFTMPGVPALYYGSEVAWGGKKTAHSDAPLRPALDPLRITTEGPERELPDAIRRLAALRAAYPALRRGSYRQVHVSPEQLAFLREHDGERLLVVLDYGETPRRLELPVATLGGRDWRDIESGVRPTVENGCLSVDTYPGWCRVLAAG